jgi:GNAT superfamily N-acetyltransferase
MSISEAGANGIVFSLHDDTLPADDAAVVDQGLGDANAAAAPLHEVRALACFARDAAGTVIGGAVGRTWGGCCELQQLWVAPRHRRAGLGAALVRRFEARALARGCTTFYLETFSFQAPALYRSLGYDAVGRNAAFPHGIVKFAMAKQVAVPAPARTGTAPFAVRRVEAGEPGLVVALADLLADAVASGASVGFVRDLSLADAQGWASSALAALGPELSLWVAEANGQVVGSVQLAHCLKPNGRHRGDVMKQLVLRSARGRGVASALLARLETDARTAGLTLLVLDTEAGSPAEAVYRHWGWRYGGTIPAYAVTPDGVPHATVHLYRTLG